MMDSYSTSNSGKQGENQTNQVNNFLLNFNFLELFNGELQ